MIDLETQLARLEAAELVRRGDEIDRSYLFKHALTQDAAYSLLLLQQRRELHRHVAQTYEELYPEQLDGFAALLAQHYTQARDDAKALEYLKRAGDAAARMYANAEAEAHYTRALELARQRQPCDGPEVEYLYRRRGRELELASQFKAALASYEEMERFAREHHDRTLELAAVMAQCQIFCTPNSEFNPDRGEPMAQRALGLARELSDRPAESKIQWILLNLYRFTDRPDRARAAGEQSLQIARDLNLQEQMAYALNDLPHAYISLGEIDQWERTLEDAIHQWRAIGNLPMLADALASFALYDSQIGNYDRALAYGGEANQISESIGNLWGQSYSLSTLGSAYWARGEAERAIAILEEALRLSEPSGYLVPLVLSRVDLALVLAGLGAFERAEEMCRLARESADTHFPSLRPAVGIAQIRILSLKGDTAGAAAVDSAETDQDTDEFSSRLRLYSRFVLAFAQHDYARVIDMSSSLIEPLRRLKLRSYLSEVLYLTGCAERAAGNSNPARDLFVQAQINAEALNMRRVLWQIYAALGELEADGGNQMQARAWRAQALEIVEYIAAHAPSDLRQSFLDLPDVRSVLSHA